MKQVFLAAVAILAGTASWAAEFSVTPVRIFMTPRDRAVAVTVVNEGNEELVMQSELYQWTQNPSGEDSLTPTEDVVLSPPILKLAPKGRQVLRLARVGAAPAGRELSFRMIVREVPEAKASQDKDVKVQMALAFSLPIFITPTGAKRNLQCGMERSAAQAVKVDCANAGNAYAQIRGMSLLSAAGETIATRDVVTYMLPDIKRTFELQSASARIPAGKVRLNVAFDDGTTQVFDGTLPD
jgi:fimbrial chaperone protein